MVQKKPKLTIEYSSKMDTIIRKKAMSPKCLQVLKDIGLSKYEAIAYHVLLKVKSATAREISQMANIPAGFLYRSLNGLIDMGFAKYGGYKPRYYEAIPRKRE